MKRTFWITLLMSLSAFTIVAQPVISVDFEQFTRESSFTQASWKTAGVSVPWVDGFNQNRVYVDASVAHSGSKSIRVAYPKGQFGPQNTGAQAPLPFVPQQQYYMSYYVRFSDDFSWGTKSEGGKLPGLSGGARCSGCDTCKGNNGFTARLMWRAGGKAVVYLYHMEKIDPCGENYDIVVNGSTLKFQRGLWYKISERIKVNTTGNHDGEVEIWINDQHAQLKTYAGTLVDQLQGIQFVSNGDKVDNLYFSTFHGGSTTDWAPTVDSYTWFDDFVVSTNKADVISITTGFSDMEATTLLENLPSFVRSNERYQLHESEQALLLEWYDRTGSCKIKHTSNNGELWVPTLASGMYIVRIKSNVSVSQKLVWVE